MSINFKKEKGFTLIELLVVIAIIGILSSVVLASLSTARAKSRDARRIADLDQVRTALETYYDSSSTYPTSTAATAQAATFDATTASGNAIGMLISGGSIAKLPSDPQNSGAYKYYYCAFAAKPTGATGCTTSGSAQNYYVLATTLERNDNQALKTDADVDTNHSDLKSTGSDCKTAGGTEQCFDLTN